MSASIRLLEPNPFVSVQDGGRQGAMRFGVSQSGPMDWVRHRLATHLVGARAAFEIGPLGATFEVTGSATIALAGPGVSLHLPSGPVAAPVRVHLSETTRLAIRPGATGMWAYLAVAGLELGKPVLGSFATNVRTGLGARDLNRAFACATASEQGVEPFADPYDDEGPIGALPGPQHHLFSDAALARFAEADWRLTQAVDRMGYQLEGPKLEAVRHDIVSDGLVEGAIQVPGNGQPIVLLADRAPTGGYPKIAVLAAADRPRLAQRRPGESVRFVWTDRGEADRRRRALAAAIRTPVVRPRDGIDPARLATSNLVSGVWGS